MSTARITLLIAGFLAFLVVILAGTLLEEAGQRDEMKACVASGKEWRRDFGNYYECLEPNQ